MLRNRIYFRVKPLIHSSLRFKMRRWYARRKLRTVQDVWPILPGSERAPEGWPGWPDGKQFGFVLTHDVEGPLGLAKCRRLMEIEARLGFRSSFNLIPEGPYRVSNEFREELRNNGFEAGVHDLHHDGKLYRNREEFSRKAERINGYLKNWEAAGFRSGLMLHNLEWLAKLNIEYDASTFDTDPFEPQPDGTGSIFPMWVPNPGAPGSGYVELPYTLVQDHTLFVLLGQRDFDIWVKKLDWVAAHHGMVLLDTHPDYMRMDKDSREVWEYPVELYEQFLAHVRSKYSGAYWHALPRDVAALVRSSAMPDQTRLQHHTPGPNGATRSGQMVWESKSQSKAKASL